MNLLEILQKAKQQIHQTIMESLREQLREEFKGFNELADNVKDPKKRKIAYEILAKLEELLIGKKGEAPKKQES